MSAPLLEAHELVLRLDGRELGTSGFGCSGSSVACVGAAAALLRSFVEPECIHGGRLSCLGADVAHSLSQRGIGYAPRRAVGPPEFEVGQALLHSARLIGATADDVEAALARVGLTRLKKERLGRLSAMQQRLLGLAHGITAHPDLLVIEDPYPDLGEEASAVVEEFLERELDGRRFIVSVEADSPYSRSLLGRADEVLYAVGSQLLGPVPPALYPSRGLWLVSSGQRSAELVALLRAAQAEVTTTPRAGVVLVRGLSGLRVLELAREAGELVHELSPAG